MFTLNLQPPEKAAPVQPDGSLDVVSVFLTLQGEGPFAGTPAVFVRTAGCNLGGGVNGTVKTCPACDTLYTTGREFVTPAALLSRVMATLDNAECGDVDLIVLTGGEPFRQDFGAFLRLALEASFRVQVETNGTLYRPLAYYNDPSFTVVCSPKTPKLNHDLERQITAYKYVVKAGEIDPKDGLPLCTMGAKLPIARPWSPAVPVFLQPLDEQDEVKNAANRKAAVESCFKHGRRLSLQTHKLLGLA